MSAKSILSNLNLVSIVASSENLDALKDFFSAYQHSEVINMLVVNSSSPSPQSSLSQWIHRNCGITVSNAVDGTMLQPGMVILATPNCEISFEENSFKIHIPKNAKIKNDSEAVLFNSIAKQNVHKVVCIILDNIKPEITKGVQALKNKGAHIIFKSPDTSQNGGAAIAEKIADLADAMLPPLYMGNYLNTYFKNLKQNKPQGIPMDKNIPPIEKPLTNKEQSQAYFEEIATQNAPTNRSSETLPIVSEEKQLTDLKKAIKTQYESEQLVNSVFNAVTIGICITDEKGFFVDVNNAYCNIYGFHKENLIGQHFTIVVPDHLKSAMKKMHDDFILGTAEVPAEFEVLNKAGEYLKVSVSAELMIQENGTRFKVTSVKDITAETNTKAALAASERRFSNLFDKVTNISVQGYDQEGNVRFWNEASEKLYGYTKSEAIGKKLWDLIIPDEMRSEVKMAVADMIAKGEGHPASELHLKRKDGSVVPVFSNHTVIKSPGNKTELFCLDIDLRDQLKTSDALRKSEQELRKILACSLDIICTLDADGRFTKVSEAASTILGYSPEALEGELIINIVHENDKEKTLHALHSIISGHPTTNFENRLISKNGMIIPIIWSASWYPQDKTMYCVARDATTLKAAELKIRESEALMNEAQKLAKMGSWNYDFRNGQLIWSDSLYDVFDANRETFKDTHGSFVSLVDEEFRALVLKTASKSKLTGEPFNIEYRITTTSGEKRYIEEFGYSEKDEGGNVVRLFGTAQDITERKHVEMLLQASEKRFKALVENSTDAIAIIGIDGNPSYVSPAIIKILGYSEEEAMQSNLFEIVHPDDIPTMALRFNEALKFPGVPVKGHVSRVRHKDGSWRWLDATLTNMLHEPAINGIIDNFRDVTEQVEKDRELLHSEKRFKAMVQEGADMTAILDMNAVFQYISPNYPVILGYSEEDLIGESCFYHLHPDDVETTQKEFARLTTETRVKSSPYRYKRKDGTWCWLQSVGTNLIDEEAISGIVINSVDVTDLINAQEVLQQSNERYHLVNQATNDGIYDWDVKNDLFTWGDGFYRNFGYKKSKKAFRLSDWINLTHPNDAEKNKEAWDSFLQNQMETKWSKKFRFRKADGQYAFVEEIGILIRDKNGDPHRMIGALRDQTEMQQKNIQKQIERELGIIFKNGENLSEILNDVLTYILDFTNSITAEVWLVGSQEKQLNFIANVANDENGREFYKLCKNVTTLKPGEGLPGKVWESGNIQIWENVHENRIFIRQKAAKAAGLTSFVGIPLNHNQKIIGSIILGGKKNATNEENNVLLLKPLGHFLGAEIARKQQEEELNHLFHSSPDIIAIATPSGHFSKVNPAFCNLLGYSEVELTSTPFKEFLHPDDIETTKKEYKETVSGGRLANNFINRYRTKSGNYKWISWSSSGIFGEEKFVFAFGRDITKVKELEQLFDSAAKLARIGSWELDMRNKEKHAMYWSPMTKKILEADDNEIPSLTGGFDLYATESKVLIEHSINKLIEEGIKFDHELLLTTFKGNERWVRCIGDSERVNGQCIRIYGSFQDIHNRKIAELELLKFKKIIEHSKDGIAIADHNGKSIYLNSGFSEMLGYTAAEINTIGGPMNVYADKETANDVFSTLLSGEYWKGDIKILNSKGEAIDFYLSGGGIFDEGGKLIAIYGIHTDISDRKNAEIALQKAFEERNSILESIGDGFLAVDRNFEITYFNHRAEAILGKKRIEVIGRNLWEVYEDAVELEFFNQYNHALQTGQTVIFESFYPSLNIWFEVSVYPSEKGLSIFFKDVTIRKTAEEQIRQSNERFEMVSAATNDAIWDYDIVNDTLFWGEGFKTLFGHDSNKVMPTLNSWTEHMHPQEKENVYTSFLNAIKSKDQTTWSAEYRYKNESGEYVYVNDRGIIVRDENGNPVRAIGAMSDITYRKSYEASLKNLNIELENRAKDLEITNAELEQFAYVASHDLQEPLRMVTSFLSQLEKKYKDHLDERAHQYIYFAVDGAKRMRQVILDLLQYSRVGRMEEDKETINLNTLIDDYCIMRNTLIEEKSATILKSNLPVITSHKSQVTQIFHNLLDNALKYTKTGVNAEISIDCNENETHWEFSVRDNGIGIDAEYFDKIFVIFQRLHDKESYSGTGIGLAIVKKIVENLDGKIRIESEKDKGSIFYFTIKK